MRTLFVSLCMLSFQGLSCSYPAIQKLDQIFTYLEKADRETLIVFDIDYTLTMPRKPAFHFVLFTQYKSSIKQWTKNLSDEEKFRLAPYLVVYGNSELIETKTPQLIDSLHDRGIKTLALTACPCLDLPGIGNLTKWRASEFQRLGLRFSSDLADFPSLSMQCFKENFGTFPGYETGILFCNSSPFLKTPCLATKGDVLRYFLEEAGWRPNHVVMVDDDEKNLEAMEQTMADWKISYQGLLYTGAQNDSIPSVSQEEMEEAWMDLIHIIQQEKVLLPQK